MNELMSMSGPMMSSKEVATLTGKRHGDVLRDVRVMLDELQNADLRPEEYQAFIASNGMTSEILLNKRLTYILVTGYSTLLRAKVVDRWQELEAAPQRQVSDPRLAAMIESLIRLDQIETAQREQEDRVRALEQQVKQIDTAVDHFTIVGWARLRNVELPLAKASKLGRFATSVCKEHGIQMGEVPDPRFGRVNTYPLAVLDDILSAEAA